MARVETLVLTTLIAALISLIHAYQVRRRRLASNPKGLPLPPGPRRLPLIGSLLEMPKDFYWITYANWAKKYGDVMYTNVCGQDMIILNSAEAALELLEKRSATYSDRPRLPMLDLMQYLWQFSVMRYGPIWRLHRRTFHQHFNQNASLKYIHILTDDSRTCLANCLKNPEGFIDHFHQFFASSVFRVTYGIRTSGKGDPFISLVEESMKGAIEAGIPGAFLVDMLPILKYVPDWFPGASFKRRAKYYSSLQGPLRDKPVEAVESAMKTGDYETSVVSELLKSRDKNGATDENMLQVIKNVAAIAFLAGSDTTLSTLSSFVLAMVLHPEVQQKLHDEITRNIGPDRLPDYHEVERIPYLHAVVRELFRWQPVVPLCLPHRNQIEDEYCGYHIPKDCIVIPNIWAILHDERTFFEPHIFRPERFMSNDGTLKDVAIDLSNIVFGFGRRICPGRHHAYNSALILASSLVAAFEIRPSETDPVPKLSNDERAREDVSRVLMESGFITHPRAFKCRFVPRSEIISRQLLEVHA